MPQLVLPLVLAGLFEFEVFILFPVPLLVTLVATGTLTLGANNSLMDFFGLWYVCFTTGLDGGCDDDDVADAGAPAAFFLAAANARCRSKISCSLDDIRLDDIFIYYYARLIIGTSY